MSIFQAIILGLVQGITEFLPISSSAHLVLVPYFLGWEDGGLSFAVVTNAATLLAAVVYFRDTLFRPHRSWITSTAWRRPGLMRSVLLATVPVAIFGATSYRWLSDGARAPSVIAATTIGFGLLLWWADRVAAGRRTLEQLTWLDGLLIGLAQAVSLVPGTSRSGATITAGLALGFNREEAARFSFLLAIPVGLLALGRDLVAIVAGAPLSVPWPPLLAGFVVSGLSAYAVIGWLLRWLRRQNLTLFVVYRLLLGLLIVLVLIGR